ncbi:hypothetical protein BGZ47_000769 [Haplosporangium gracile]|nr:hypothetical protein BGZ47_000769 [Haplosporangium gracile]
MSEIEFDAEAQSTKLHAIYGHHHRHHHEHTLSAVDLTIKLEQLQIDTNNNNAEDDGQELAQDDSLLSPNGEERRHHRSHSRHRHHHYHSRHHSRSRSRSHSRQRTIAHVDPEFQKWSHEALHEILDHLEQQRRESEFFQSEEDFSMVPGMEDNGSGRMRHTQGLSPEMLKDLSLRHRSLKQSHGQANLRHS